jgi:GNAT superfamily N-acetyltransferase
MTFRGKTFGYTVEPLGPNQDRKTFTCGVDELDLYLRQHASQDGKRKLAAVFILTSDGTNIAGFYTLSAYSILAAELPVEFGKKLPRFPLPVTLLGRMAVSESLRGRGLGEFLLMHALERAWLGSLQVASWAVVVDAKSGAREFYVKHSFLPLPNRPERLFLPMKTIEGLFAE